MKKIKKHILILVLLSCTCQLFSQKDSIHSLFKAPKFNVQYSYLQWEFGYNGFLFNSVFINGINVDFVGIVLNDDYNFAIGLEQGGTRAGYRTPVFTNMVLQSYSGFYLKIEPMLLPEKTINISMPLKLGIGTLSYSDTSSYTQANGRRGRRNTGTSFTFFEPGLFTFVNVLPTVNFGAGISYRVALTTSGAHPINDYDNFTFSALVRLRVFTRNKRKIDAKNNNYYSQPERFQ